MEDLNVFTVTPMNQKLDLDPGKTYTGSITVVNPDNATKDFKYKASISSYGVVGEGYDVDFVTQSEHTQIVDWIKIENPTGTIKPNGTAKVNFTIKVPRTAPAGGQYATILVSSADDGDSGDGLAVKNIFEMASIIYANVSGETKHEGEILDNHVPGFVTSIPIQVSAGFKNDGNSHEYARISLQVKSVFSSSLIYPTEDESGVVEEVIMPGTTRYTAKNIEGISPLGIYEVTQTVNYMGDVKTVKQIVIASPIWFMALVLLTIGAIVLTIVASIKKHRHKRDVF
jgi:hypothetical protein